MIGPQPDRRRNGAGARLAPGQTSGQGDRANPVREALTAGPTHRRRMGVDALASAIFPDAGIGLECCRRGVLAERFEEMKQPSSPGRGRRRSKNIGMAARMTLP